MSICTKVYIEVSTKNPLLSDMLVSMVEKEQKGEITSISENMGCEKTQQIKASYVGNGLGREEVVFSQKVESKGVPYDFIAYLDSFEDSLVYAKVMKVDTAGFEGMEYRTGEGWWNEEGDIL